MFGKSSNLKGSCVEVANYLTRIDDPMQWVNLTVATITNIGALYIVATMGYWWFRLRYSRTDLRPLVFAVVVAKFALWFWTFLNIFNIIAYDESQPNVTLPARLAFLFAVMVQVYVTIRVRPTPVAHGRLEDELDCDGRLVLIVEDNEALGRIYRRCLETAGINAEFVTSGRDALIVIAQEKPRMMIVDLGLPDMDGVELVGQARAAGYGGPIMAISGAASLMDVNKLEPAAFVQIVQKPIRSAELVTITHRWLSRAAR